MRLEDYDAKAGKKCWLDRHEVELLLGAADSVDVDEVHRGPRQCFPE